MPQSADAPPPIQPSLVVVPASVRGQWIKELDAWGRFERIEFVTASQSSFESMTENLDRIVGGQVEVRVLSWSLNG